MKAATKEFKAQHFLWDVTGKVGTITLNRPERKNALTFDSYRELIALFRALPQMPEVNVVVLTGAGEDFCSGGDVHEIIGPLVKYSENGEHDKLLDFTRMTGDLVKAMRACPQLVIAAIDGICAGAGAILAVASDFRIGTPRSKVAFLFSRVGLSGADMGACALLPRMIGLGRASELLYTGRFMPAEEAERVGFFNKIIEPGELLKEARKLAEELAAGPTFALAVTKRGLNQEMNANLEDAIDAEAKAQARCMQTQDFARAYRAFVAKSRPVFKGD